MKILIFIIVIFQVTHLHSEESSYQFTIESHMKNLPIKFNKTNENVKTPLSLKLNTWTVSPNSFSFTSSKLKTEELEEKNKNNLIYIKFKLKF